MKNIPRKEHPFPQFERKNWLNLNGKFIEGAAVYITGKMVPRFRFQEDSPLDFKVTNVELLQTVKEKAIDRITITINADKDRLTSEIVNELQELIHDHPGKTKLFFQLRDGTGKYHVLLRSKSHLVDVKHQLIDFIERTDVLDYKIN